MNWILWQNIVSPHLSPIARALASMPDQTVTVVAEEEMPKRRSVMGWQTPDCSPARVWVRPTDADVESLITGIHGQLSVHLLNGLPGVALNRGVLPRLARTEAMIGLVSEGADDRGAMGIARKVKYRLDRYLIGKNFDFIFAMGQLGVRWFESAGYEPSRIFPFGYVTERPVCALAVSCDGNATGQFRILYLGRMDRRKDGITAILALEKLSTSTWQFDLIGDGPDLQRWKQAAEASGVAARIHFLPAVDNRMIGHLLEHADLLLLPSRKDGWGAVVNEALMSGVPVICSDNCGAADLLREPWRGSTFKAGSVTSLQGKLQGWIESGRRTEKSSARIREWSSVLEGPRVAQYLVDVVEYVRSGGLRPSPPWY